MELRRFFLFFVLHRFLVYSFTTFYGQYEFFAATYEIFSHGFFFHVQEMETSENFNELLTYCMCKTQRNSIHETSIRIDFISWKLCTAAGNMVLVAVISIDIPIEKSQKDWKMKKIKHIWKTIFTTSMLRWIF